MAFSHMPVRALLKRASRFPEQLFPASVANIFVSSKNSGSILSSRSLTALPLLETLPVVETMAASQVLQGALLSPKLCGTDSVPQHSTGRHQWAAEQACFLIGSARSFRSLTAGISTASVQSLRKGGRNGAIPVRLEASYHAGMESQTDEESAVLATVPWDKTKVNTVYLTGNIGRDVRITTTATNRTVAITSLALSRKMDGERSEETDWFELEMWGALAETAARYLKQGDKVQVKGRVKIDKWTGRDGDLKTTVKVVASELATVDLPAGGQTERQPGMRAERVAETSHSESSAGSAGRLGRELTIEEKWIDFFENPEQWWDNREVKASTGNMKQPDFKRKEALGPSRPEALWTDAKFKPAWVDGKLAEMFGSDGGDGEEEGAEQPEWEEDPNPPRASASHSRPYGQR